MQITNKMNENQRRLLFVIGLGFVLLGLAELYFLTSLHSRLRTVEQQLKEHITYKPE